MPNVPFSLNRPRMSLNGVLTTRVAILGNGTGIELLLSIGKMVEKKSGLLLMPTEGSDPLFLTSSFTAESA